MKKRKQARTMKMVEKKMQTTRAIVDTEKEFSSSFYNTTVSSVTATTPIKCSPRTTIRKWRHYLCKILANFCYNDHSTKALIPEGSHNSAPASPRGETNLVNLTTVVSVIALCCSSRQGIAVLPLLRLLPLCLLALHCTGGSTQLK